MQAVCDGLYREGCISEAGQTAWERFNRDTPQGAFFANEFAPTTQASSTSHRSRAALAPRAGAPSPLSAMPYWRMPRPLTSRRTQTM